MGTGDDCVGPINMGSTYEFTMNQLAEKVIELTGSQSKVVYAPLPLDDPVHRRPDLGQARQRLGWEPSVSLDKGLQQTIEYFRSLLHQGNEA